MYKYYLALAELPLADAVAGPLHHNEEVHPVNARVRVVLEPEIDVLADSEPPVARVREVAPAGRACVSERARVEECVRASERVRERDQPLVSPAGTREVAVPRRMHAQLVLCLPPAGDYEATHSLTSASQTCLACAQAVCILRQNSGELV